MKRIEVVKDIEYGKEKQVWNGDKRYYHKFLEQMKKLWKTNKVESAVKNYKIKEEPVGVIDLMTRYNNGTMLADELAREGGTETVALWMKIIQDYEKNGVEAREKGDVAMHLLEGMLGKEVLKATSDIREDEEEISLIRVREAMKVIADQYGQEDVGTQMKVNLEVTNIGYCETHKDVTMLIEILDAYQTERKAIAGMIPMTDLEMIQHLVTRFPKAKDRKGMRTTVQVFYEHMLEEISIKQTKVKWTDVVENRRAKLEILKLLGDGEEEEEEKQMKKESIVNMSVRQGEDSNYYSRGGNRDNRGGGGGRNGYNMQGRGGNGRESYGVQARNNSYIKTRQCLDWGKKEGCRYGEQCRFLHGEGKQGKESGGKRDTEIRTIKKVNATRKRRESEDEDSEEDNSEEEREHKILQEMMKQSKERRDRRQQKKKNKEGNA